MSYALGSCSHAEGYQCRADGGRSHAGGMDSQASGEMSFAHGYGVIAGNRSQVAFGEYNVNYSGVIFNLGYGSSSSRKSIAYVQTNGNSWIAGTLSQNSDRRLKEHLSYLGDDACEFVRKLKPALFIKDDERHVGFYAQNVQESEPDNWDTVTVVEVHSDESLDFDPLTLDYTALIAPLVAYAQSLESRIGELESKLSTLLEKLGE